MGYEVLWINYDPSMGLWNNYDPSMGLWNNYMIHRWVYEITMIHRWVMKHYEITMVRRLTSLGAQPGTVHIHGQFWADQREQT